MAGAYQAYLVAVRACQRPSVRSARDRQSEAGDRGWRCSTAHRRPPCSCRDQLSRPCSDDTTTNWPLLLRVRNLPAVGADSVAVSDNYDKENGDEGGCSYLRLIEVV